MTKRLTIFFHDTFMMFCPSTLVADTQPCLTKHLLQFQGLRGRERPRAGVPDFLEGARAVCRRQHA